MGRRSARRDDRLRLRIAREAARLLAQSGSRDYAAAKQKAAERLGSRDRSVLPGNDEIESALLDYLQLFRASSQPQELRRLRAAALEAMEFLAPFTPRLVGQVLSGTADRHGAVELLAFADSPEELILFLDDRRIPHQAGERRMRVSAQSFQAFPAIGLVAGETTVEIVVLPRAALQHPPLSPIDGTPLRGAGADAVRRLLEP